MTHGGLSERSVSAHVATHDRKWKGREVEGKGVVGHPCRNPHQAAAQPVEISRPASGRCMDGGSAAELGGGLR